MKHLKYISILFFLILMAGCGAKDGEKILEETLENMKEVESGTIKVEMNSVVDGYTIYIDTTTDFNKLGESHTITTSKILGFTFVNESYTIINDDKVYVYSNENEEQWIYEVFEKDDYEVSEMTVNGVGNLAKNYKSVKEISSDLEDHKKLEVVIDSKVMKEMLEQSQENGAEANFELEEDLIMYIYVKDGYISKMMFNFEDASSADEENAKTTYAITFTILNHNKIDKIELPNNVEEQAIDLATIGEE